MQKLEQGLKYLVSHGLNLISILDCGKLPNSTSATICDSGIALFDYKRLLLIGHGGRLLWHALRAKGMETVDPVDPVDHYSVTVISQFIQIHLRNAPLLWLYPLTQHQVPLQQLGAAAGWDHPSPLGLGISPDYGLWYAYRAALLIDADLPLTPLHRSLSPCDGCSDKPCVRHCPVGAVRSTGMAMEVCAKQRLAEKSICADRCPARMACPVHPEHRYELDQIQYHYRHSLATLRDWYAV